MSDELITNLPTFKWKTDSNQMERVLDVWSINHKWIPHRFYEEVSEHYSQYLPYFGSGSLEMFEDIGFDEEAFIFNSKNKISPYWFQNINSQQQPPNLRLSVASLPSNLTELATDECIVSVTLYPKKAVRDFDFPLFSTHSIFRSEVWCLRILDFLNSKSNPHKMSAVGFRHSQQIQKELVGWSDKGEIIETTKTYHKPPSLFFIVEDYSSIQNTIFDFTSFCAEDDSIEWNVRMHHSKGGGVFDLAELATANQSDERLTFFQNAKPYRILPKNVEQQRFNVKVDDVITHTQYRYKATTNNKPPFFLPPKDDGFFPPIPKSTSSHPPIGFYTATPYQIMSYGKDGGDEGIEKNGRVNVYNCSLRFIENAKERKDIKYNFTPIGSYFQKQIAQYLKKKGVEGGFDGDRGVTSFGGVTAIQSVSIFDLLNEKNIYRQNAEQKVIPFFFPPKIADKRDRRLEMHSSLPTLSTTHPFHKKDLFGIGDADDFAKGKAAKPTLFD